MTLLSVLSVVGEAYRFVWRERQLLWGLALPGLIVLSLMDALALIFPFANAGPSGAVLWIVMKLVLFSAVVILYSVAWHRAYLIAGDPADLRSVYRWQPRHTKFLLNYVKTALIAVPVFLAGSFVAGLLTLPIGGAKSVSGFVILWLVGTQAVVWIAAGAIGSRFAMLFPATAVDEHMSLGACWSLTYGNGLRLLGIIVLSAIPFWVVYLPVQLATQGGITSLGLRGWMSMNLMLAILEQAVSLIAVAIGVSALSIAYRHIRDHSAAAPSATTPP
ncbi:MAG: hypothetical protein K0Q70_382 [Rhodospirillales bacterium]|jgi:hypothetical protein|nr:hypothetical protein [Rhodospirillales bacterium]